MFLVVRTGLALAALVALALPSACVQGEPEPAPVTHTLAHLSDDFGDLTSYANWTVLNDLYVDDAAITQDGQFRILPTADTNLVWHMGSQAPFVYKTVAGDFVVQMSLSAHVQGDATAPPPNGATGNNAGILVRDPLAGQQEQNFVAYSLGRLNQDASWYDVPPPAGHDLSTMTPLGTEFSRTTAGVSVNRLRYGEAHSGRLALCRIGATFRMYRWLDGEQAWTQEFEASDVPGVGAEVQVGMALNAFVPSQLEGSFDWVRFGSVSAWDDCTRDL